MHLRALTSRRGMAVFGVRAAGGILGVGIIGIAVGAAALVPWPQSTAPSTSVLVAPAPTEQLRVCPGPLLTLAQDSRQAQTATSFGRAGAISGARSPAESGWLAPESTALSAPDNATGNADGAPLLLRVPVGGGAVTAPLVAGGQSQLASGGTVAGLAAAACAETAADAWLVGGSSDVGHTSLILLSNPSTVVARVALTVFGEAGRLDAPGSTGILVQPGSQRIIPLAGLAPNVLAPVVRVTSEGGQVSATLQHSTIHGIVPAGVDLVGPSTAPGLSQVIPGVLVTTLVQAFATGGEPPEGMPSVRILVPGTKAATVTVALAGTAGTAGGSSQRVDLQPGNVTEVPVLGLAPGAYTATVTSTQPIVAAAQTSTTGTSGRDFAWFAASGAVRGAFAVTVPAGPSPSLNLVNTAGGDATYAVTAENGTPVTVSVPAGGSAAVPLVASTRYVVSGGSSTAAAVGFVGDGLLASFPLSPSGPLATPLRVYPR